MDDLDLDGLEELLTEELKALDVENPVGGDSDKNEAQQSANSDRDLEKELQEMQKKMDQLREQLQNKQAAACHSSTEKTTDCLSPAITFPKVTSGLSNCSRVTLLEDDIFSKSDDVGGERLQPCNKSVVHSGDTDSSDDEKRYPTTSALTKTGKAIKRNLEDKKSPSAFLGRSAVTWATKRKSLVPLNPAGEAGVRDPYSGIRIINPMVSSTVMEARMAGRKMVKMSLVPTFVKSKNVEDDWVTVGVLVSKSAPKTSKNGKLYSIWKLTDLQDCENFVSIFLFGDVHDKHWKTSIGTVLGFLNPSVMPNRDSYSSRTDTCLSIDHPGKIMPMGTSKDFGTCKGKTRDGQFCTNVVNRATCPFCVYHVKAEYRKMSSKRTELQASFSGVAPSGLRQKVLKKSQIMYGGQLFTNPVPEASKTLKKKEKLVLNSLKVARHAEDLEKSARLSFAATVQLGHMSSEENDAIKKIAAKSDFLGQALCSPGAGSRNFLRHVVKDGAVDQQVADSKRNMVSITAKGLLKLQQQKLRALGTSKTLGLSRPVLGRGLADGKMVDLGGSLAHMKALSASDIAKIRAVQKVKAKGALPARDPNAVRKDLTSSDAKERIQKKLEETETTKETDSEEPLQKKSRLGGSLSETELKRILAQRSSHAHQLDELETEQEMQYFSTLEKKEQLEEKMLSIKEIQCDVVSCRTCKYTAHQASDLCRKEGHLLKHHKATKRFFKCKDCSYRTTTFSRVPSQSCRNCNGSNFERTSMGKPRPGPKLESEKLLIRGEEAKFLNK